MNKGKLYLIPSPLGDNDPAEVIPGPVLGLLQRFRTFVVEETRTARRYLSKAGLKGRIDELEFFELNEHTAPEQVEDYIRLFEDGNDVALISEAGLPAVADPGARLVELAHGHGVEVVPCVGPSSLMLALMASGLNGQSFAFCGYLPAKGDERRARLKAIEKTAISTGQSQIFIETPYRNDSMLSDIASHCRPSTMVSVAADLTLESQTILSMDVAAWSRKLAGGFRIGKRPCVFVLSASDGF